MKLWQRILASIVAQNIHFDLVAPRQVVGERVTWTNNTSVDPWRKLGIAPLQGQGDATVHGGKIVSLTITLTPDSMAKLQRAVASSPPPRRRIGSASTFRSGPLVIAVTFGWRRSDCAKRGIVHTVAGRFLSGKYPPLSILLR
jgi:hypothetical protein